MELPVADRKDAINAIVKQRLGRLAITAVLEENLQHFVDLTWGKLFNIPD